MHFVAGLVVLFCLALFSGTKRGGATAWIMGGGWLGLLLLSFVLVDSPETTIGGYIVIFLIFGSPVLIPLFIKWMLSR